MNDNLNDNARAILADAAVKLRALGLHCAIGPLSMPQGLSLNLHVADTALAAAAAYVAAGHGGEAAHARDTAEAFAEEVAHVLTTDAIERAARQPE